MPPQPSQVMGIVNINDDSFSNDGTLDPAAALDIAQAQLADGAHIIDIGAESARTNRGPITPEEEIRRIDAFLQLWTDAGLTAQLSLNTWRSEVLSAVLPGSPISIVNDISGLPDARNAELAATYGARLLIMHSIGQPKVPHLSQTYPDVWDSLLSFFEEKIALAESAGMTRNQLILDPGIDFAKQRVDNLIIYKNLEKLTTFGIPLLIPVSRKTVIGQVLSLPRPEHRDAGTLACLAAAHHSGRHIYRVHNVKAATSALTVLDRLT